MHWRKKDIQNILYKLRVLIYLSHTARAIIIIIDISVTALKWYA